ncbi:cupin [Bacillus sp. TS-2]|nr:cupin [Bacillus sp. TS-2]
MAVSYMDFTANDVQFFDDVQNNRLFTRNNQNYINVLGRNQLNTLGNVSLLDIYLSNEKVVEPHIHQNATELVYCISGSAVVSLMNPFTKEIINLPITPGQVANVPQGWWHYEIANEDDTHLLAVFDAPYPQVILGSDILRLTPANVLAHTYCLNEEMVKDTLAPITSSVFIGPEDECSNRYSPIDNQTNPIHHQDYSPSINQSHYQAAPYPATYNQPSYYVNQAPVRQSYRNYSYPYQGNHSSQ